MPPGKVNLKLYQGDDFARQITFTTRPDPDPDPTAPGIPVDLDGYDFSAQIRKISADSDEDAASGELADFVCTLTDAANGVLTISLDHDSSSTYLHDVTKARWDLEGLDRDGVLRTYLQGLVIITPEITRIPMELARDVRRFKAQQ